MTPSKISPLILFFLLIVFYCAGSAKVRHHSGGKQGLKYLTHGIGNGYGNVIQTSENIGLWPSVFNVATKALISVNATCGEGGREEFCRISEGVRGRCGVCDNFSPDPGKKHSIHYALDGTNRWWQSPTLHNGPGYEYVTITLDLKQVYQVAYVIIKAANSPRPGAWILEKSIDGEDYESWQYFARYDKECLERYGIPATKGKPHYITDSDVICTSYYSKLSPVENGEIHTSLVHGRPGANETSPELLEFTKARYVRLKFQGFRATVEPVPRWLSQDISKDKRLFYSIRDISIGGQCVCNGHAAQCRHNVASGHPECECAHHTCGPNCDRCCPMYNQRQWGPGSSRDARKCLPCNCHGHATSCHYEEAVDRAGLSLDINGNRQGGGVCDNCTAYTTGINCEKCIRSYYRPFGVSPDAEIPCHKCDCNAFGSTGFCDQEGYIAGNCQCKPGYTGRACDQCASGYRGFPNCEVCPCDSKGVVPHNDCENECVCKIYVDGKNCDHCKSGHFALRSDNPEGCAPCYCSGVTTLCESAILVPQKLEALKDWQIADISISKVVAPAWNPEANTWIIGNYEIPDVESFYWLAPKEYLGNKLESYGSYLNFKVHWIVMRGDTSGKPTAGPNIILVGSNGMKIAYGDDEYGGSNATFQIKLQEYQWYHVPSTVKDIITRLRRTEYRGDPVTRFQFLSVLTNIKYVLLRATFHTDQIEGMLEGAVLESGHLEEYETYSPVEKCSCPSGYTGLSCENCDYGYVRIVTNVSSHQEQGFCVKCDCNGHSETCNPDTGQCFCKHNTIGEKCERCTHGYYGNPLAGTPHDCKKCACPLIEEENNFSPSCQLDYFAEENGEMGGYVCTQCPKGYTGDHCELCDDGYFGDPTEHKSRCEPCSCGGGRCDRLTGQCLGCPGNTEGWRCEKCKKGYFGDPLTGGCQACLCDPNGSLSAECDNVTGQCLCKEHFIGRTCEECEAGYGNVTASCTLCTCNKIGSKSDVCNTHTGICDCKSGVEGFHCDACQHLHFGFSEIGCQSCNCNPRGSEISTCDITTGQCRCKPFYIGRTCDRCQDGHWESINGCTKCECDLDGSQANICHPITGQCGCKPGVVGLRCDICLPNYYGFSSSGCRPCELCDKKGHMCDPDTGRCVCPPYSHGEHCHLCSLNTWDYEPNKGCKPCNCSNSGSSKMQCNILTGECNCRLGYTGFNCNRCTHGYYGYPRCRRCNCNFSGTDRYKAKCDKNGICQCNEEGKCACKTNVSGKKCDTCKEGTFGLHLENPDGCTQCFCFGRSSKCTEAGLTWGQLRLNASRVLTVDTTPSHNRPEIESSEKLLVIPGIHGNLTINRYHFDSPLYWKLHPVFNGDHVLSYGGYLRFISHTINSRQRLPQNIINHYPLVQLRGQGRIVLEYYPPLPSKNDRHEVRLHESLWKRIYPKDTHLSPRELLMITLQNVQNIFIKASDSSEFESLILQDVVLDTAIEIPGSPPPLAKGVEMCECPRQYSSSSCQDPSIGFFRYYTPSSVNGTILIDTFIGQARPCECNGRSSVCNTETGYCQSCKYNTDGRYCEKCAEGYYGNPMLPFGKCEPCPCPSITQNFARECKPLAKPNQFVCNCKPGYTGLKCDRCSSGYYGQPQVPGGTCQPCNCNIEGRASDECDSETGQCNCKPGIIGRQCSQCEKPRHILQKYKCTPCDKCTQWLLDDIDSLSNDLYLNAHFLQNGTIEPPWSTLRNLENRYQYLNDKLALYLEDKLFAEELITNASLNKLEAHLQSMQDKLKKRQPELTVKQAKDLMDSTKQVADDIHKSKHDLQKLIETLQNFGKSHVSTKEAVKQARELVRQIASISNEMRNYPHKEVLQKCERVKNLIEKLVSKPMTDPKELKHQLSKLDHRLKDLESILTDVEITNNEVDMKNHAHEIHLARLTEKIENIKRINDNKNKELTNTRKTIDKTYKLLNDTKDIYDILLYDNEFSELLQRLQDKDTELTVIEPNEYLEPVLEHVRQLEKNSTEYAKLFNLSSKEIDALKASEAYANIKKFIDEAEKAANEAMNEVNSALDTLSPEGKDSIAINTSISLADSERLEIRVQHQMENLAGIRQRKNNLAVQVSTVDSSNWSNGLRNRDQDNTLRDIKNKVSKFNQEKIEDLIRDAIKQTNRIKNVHRSIMDIEISKQYELEKPLQTLLNLTTSDKLKKLQEQIQVTKDELKGIFERNHTYLDTIRENTAKIEQFRKRNSSVANKLEELKTKIESAKKTAGEIRLSLVGSDCSRSYTLSNLSPSLVTKLTVKFNYTMTSEKNTSSSLFYIANVNNQFMNLKIIENTLYFEWKLENNLSRLKYILNQSESYQIDIERIGEYTQMMVKSKDVDFKRRSKIGESNNGTVIFKATPTDLLQIGSAPNVELGIPNCIRDVYYDGYRIGLWNFYKSSGECRGCVRNNELTLESTYDFYKGDGYAIIPQELQYENANPSKFNVQFSLRTFDENALLFLAADTERKNYIAITLKDGYIQYQVHYTDHKDIILTTKQKYNHGDKVRVSAEKVWEKSAKKDIALLKIIGDPNPLKETRMSITSSSLLRLKKVNYYFGGVPPGYFLESNGTTALLHTHQSLLGALDELKEYQLFSDSNINKYSVVKQSGELEFRKAWFEAMGYVELKVKQMKHKILFLLRTKDSDSFIMFVNEIARFSITDGKVNVKLYDKYSLTSNQAIDDDEYYLIELVKQKKPKKTTEDVVFKINGVIQDSVKIEDIPTNNDDEKDKDNTMKIYIGGVPDSLVREMEGNPLFSGSISDIIIDNEIITFNKEIIKTFKGVKIGRTEPQQFPLQKTPNNLQKPDDSDVEPTEGGPFNMKEMQNTEGCGQPLNYTFDPNAAKFGDKHNSHVLHYLKDSFWKKDYTLEIQFRTLQPKGMLFSSFGPKQHYNMLEIRDGKINFKASGKRKKEIILPQKVDDGQWYSIIIETTGQKKKRRLTIAINGYKTKPMKPPKNRVTRELFIGGVSENITVPSIIRNELYPFRGCIRGLKINKVAQSLVRDKNTIHHNIGQCFPSIERGSYFGGDAYAIYSKLFRIHKILELNLEFRTAEQNGILLSVSNPRNSPALSIELQNGAIVMTTDNGYGVITNVTNNLSDFALCNNQWHNLTAVYTSMEITINVDGIRKIWVQPDDETLMDELEAPLYIGGLPDYAPFGTLKMKENFKGCIRNMKIGDRMIDWINIEKVTNVLLDSCPMIS